MAAVIVNKMAAYGVSKSAKSLACTFTHLQNNNNKMKFYDNFALTEV